MNSPATVAITRLRVFVGATSRQVHGVVAQHQHQQRLKQQQQQQRDGDQGGGVGTSANAGD